MYMIIRTFRGLLLVSIALIALGGYISLRSSKDRDGYEQATGQVTYLAPTYGTYPKRHKGKGRYRYLQLDSYPYPFEIYLPNSDSVAKPLDSLSVGEEATVYFYEIGQTRRIQLNKFAQFVDHHGQPYYVRSKFQQQVGMAIVGLSVVLLLIGLFFWRRGQLSW